MSKIAEWRQKFSGAVSRVEQESIEYRQEHALGKLDWQVIGVIIFASVMLSLQEYYGSSNHYSTLEPVVGLFIEDPKKWLEGLFRGGKYGRLARLWYWSTVTSVCYMLIPMLYVKFVMKQRIRDYGFSVKGILDHAWIYIGMFAIVLPALFVVGNTDSFQRTYPFYKQAGRSAFDFFMWEFAYIAQFLSLEFFFRGFLVHGLKHRMGMYCVLVAVMPYCMIHFGKPMPETLGAIFAGLALGTLSLFTRSIWLGVAIHVSVAISMDIIALWYAGKLFT